MLSDLQGEWEAKCEKAEAPGSYRDLEEGDKVKVIEGYGYWLQEELAGRIGYIYSLEDAEIINCRGVTKGKSLFFLQCQCGFQTG